MVDDFYYWNTELPPQAAGDAGMDGGYGGYDPRDGAGPRELGMTEEQRLAIEAARRGYSGQQPAVSGQYGASVPRDERDPYGTPEGSSQQSVASSQYDGGYGGYDPRDSGAMREDAPAAPVVDGGYGGYDPRDSGAMREDGPAAPMVYAPMGYGPTADYGYGYGGYGDSPTVQAPAVFAPDMGQGLGGEGGYGGYDPRDSAGPREDTWGQQDWARYNDPEAMAWGFAPPAPADNGVVVKQPWENTGPSDYSPEREAQIGENLKRLAAGASAAVVSPLAAGLSALGMDTPDSQLGQAQRMLLGQGSTLGQRMMAAGTVVGDALNFGLGAAQGLIGNVSANLPVVKGSDLYDRSTWRTDVQIEESLNAHVNGVANTARALGIATGNDYMPATGTPDLAMLEGGGFAKPMTLETWARDQAKLITVSGPEAGQRATERMLLGESPDVVRDGFEKPAREAGPEVQAAYAKSVDEYLRSTTQRAYVNAIRAGRDPESANAEALDAREQAAKLINSTGAIPGERNMAAELIYGAMIDPLNLPGVSSLTENLFGAAIEGLKGTERAGRMAITAYDDTMETALKAAQRGVPEWMVTARGTVAASDNPVAKMLGKVLEAGDSVFGYAPQTEVKTMVGMGVKQFGSVMEDVRTAEEAAAVIAKLADDPQALVQRFGNVPVSFEAEMARPALKAAKEQLIETAAKYQTPQGFDLLRFVGEAQDVLYEAAQKIVPGALEELSPALKFAQSVKSWMGEFYLKTPGYVIRNWLGDNVTATMDGLRMFEDMKVVQRELGQLGITNVDMLQAAEALAPRVKGAAAAMGERGATAMQGSSKLSNVPIIGAIQNKIGEVAEKGEQARRMRAMHSGLTDFFALNHNPNVGASTRAALEAVSPGLTDKVEAGLRMARSGNEYRKVMSEALNATHSTDTLFVNQFLDRADELPLAMQQQMREELRAMAKRGGTVEDAAKYFDDLKAAHQTQASVKISELGQAYTPPIDVAKIAQQDVMEQMGKERQWLKAHFASKGTPIAEVEAALKASYDARMTSERLVIEARNKAGARLLESGAVDGAEAETRMSRMRWAMDKDFDLTEAGRSKADEILRKAQAEAKRIDEGGSGNKRAIWDRYRREVDTHWNGVNTEKANVYEAVIGNRPEVGTVASNLGEARAQTIIEQIQKGLQGAELETFERARQNGRLNVDIARADSWRQATEAAKANPTIMQQLMGTMYAAEADSAQAFRQAVGKKQALLNMKDSGAITFEVYNKRVGEAWQEAFDFAAHRYGKVLPEQLRVAEVAGMNVAEGLQALGYGDKDLGRLLDGLNDGSTTKEVAQILKERKVLDPAAAAEKEAMYAKRWADGEMNPPASVEDLLQRGKFETPEEALKYAQEARATAERLAVDPLAEMEAAREALPDRKLVTQWLDKDGNPKMVKDPSTGRVQAWTEGAGHSKGVDTVAQEWFEAQGKTFGEDSTGGQVQAFADELRKAWDLDRQMAEIKATGKRARAVEHDVAGVAAERWDGIAAELQTQIDTAAGIDARTAGARDYVRQVAQEQGIADAVQIKRDMGIAHPAIDEALNAEIVAKAKLGLENEANSVEQMFYWVEDTLGEGLFGVQNGTPEFINSMKGYREAKGIPMIKGLEAEMRVQTIRAMADDLGIEAGQLIKSSERSASEVIDGARKTNAALVDQLLGLPTTKSGQISAEAWQQLINDGVVAGKRTAQIANETLSPAQQAALNKVKQLETQLANAKARSQTAQIAKADATITGLNANRTRNVADTNAMQQTLSRDLYAARKEAEQLGAMAAKTTDATQTTKAIIAGERRSVGEILLELAPSKPFVPELTAEEAAAIAAKALGKKAIADPPTYIDKVLAGDKVTAAAIDKVKAKVATPEFWNARVTPVAGAEQLIHADLQRLLPQLAETRAAAISHAQQRMNFALLDYGQKRGWDMYAAAFAPYYYWGSRQARNFAARLMERPQILANYLRYKDAMKEMNQERGGRQRIEGGIAVGNLPKALGGGRLYIDPVDAMFPFAGLFDSGMENPEQTRGALAQGMDMAALLGFRAGPLIDVPLRYSNAMVVGDPNAPEGSEERKRYEQSRAAYGDASIGNLIPQTGLIKGATALLGIGGPSGVDIERPLRAAVGLPEAGRFESYRTGRAVRDMAAEEMRGSNWQVLTPEAQGARQQQYLLTQALIARRDEKGWDDLMRHAKPEDVAKEMGVSVAQAEAALKLAREAQGRASKNAGVTALMSGLAGQRTQVEGEGERLYNQMARDERGAAYNAITGTGSKAGREAVREANPALEVGKAQYATLPGDDTDPMRGYWRIERETATKAFDTLKDEVISKRPWDRSAAYGVDEAKYEALDGIGGKGQVASGKGPEAAQDWRGVLAGVKAMNPALKGSGPEAVAVESYRPRSVSGGTPAEAIEIRTQELLRAVSGTQPKAEKFMTEDGRIDMAAYKAAVKTWQEGLPLLAKGNGTVQAILAQAAKDGPAVAQQVQAALDGLSMDGLNEYRRRNDSPAEAAQRAWYELVYGKAMDAYAQRKTEKGSYEATVGSVGAMDGAQLAGLVQQLYGDRWTAAELSAALKDFKMPSMKEVIKANVSPDKKPMNEARDAYYAQLERIPPGKGAAEFWNNPLVAALSDEQGKKLATAETYRQAALIAAGFVRANRIEENPSEWASAKAQKEMLDGLIAGKFGDTKALMDGYYQAKAGPERAAYVARNPEALALLEMRKKFEAQNPIYAKYYGAQAGKGQGASGTGAGGTGGGSGASNGTGGGTGGGTPKQQFERAVASVPKGSAVLNDPVIKALMTSSTAKFATPEQYAAAVAKVQGYAQAQGIDAKAAQEQNKQLDATLRKAVGNDLTLLLYRYDGLSAAERAKMLTQVPELGQALQVRNQFIESNPAYKAFYVDSQKQVASGKGQVASGGGGAGGKAQAAGGRVQVAGGTGGGGVASNGKAASGGAGSGAPVVLGPYESGLKAQGSKPKAQGSNSKGTTDGTQLPTTSTNSTSDTLKAAKAEFDQLREALIPPGNAGKEAYAIPLVQVLTSSSKNATPEQYQQAVAQLLAWAQRNGHDVEGQGWQRARAQRDELGTLLEKRFGAETVKLLWQYDGNSAAKARAAMIAQYPVIGDMLALRNQFAAQAGEYKKFFLDRNVKTGKDGEPLPAANVAKKATSAKGKVQSAKGKVTSGGRTFTPSRGGGGGGRGGGGGGGRRNPRMLIPLKKKASKPTPIDAIYLQK